MVISFEEKDRVVIESKRMTIIEFKRSLYKISQNVSGACTVLKDIKNKITNAWEAFKDRFIKAADNIKFVVEQVMKAYNYPAYPTMRRYRVVKFLSKCTGIDKLTLWKMTRNTWLARSYC